MTREQIKAQFPNATESVLALADAVGTDECKVAVATDTGNVAAPSIEPNPLRLTIIGQVRGGKNNMLVLRNGMHVPNPQFNQWAKDTILRVKAQLPRDFVPFSVEVNVTLNYFAGDHRRRDAPAIMDAIWHVLERAGVVTDDSLLWPVESRRYYDKANPRVELVFTDK